MNMYLKKNLDDEILLIDSFQSMVSLFFNEIEAKIFSKEEVFKL